MMNRVSCSLYLDQVQLKLREYLSDLNFYISRHENPENWENTHARFCRLHIICKIYFRRLSLAVQFAFD